MIAFLKPLALVMLALVVSNLVIAYGSSSPEATGTPASTPPATAEITPRVNLNLLMFDKLYPMTAPMEEIVLEPAITNALLINFQPTGNIALKAFVTKDPYDFSLIDKTLSDLNYYEIMTPLDQLYFFGGFFLARLDPQAPQLALKYISLDPRDPTATRVKLADEFKKLPLSPEDCTCFSNQLAGKLNLFFLVTGSQLLETYASLVEPFLKPVTSFQFSQIGNPITLPAGGLVEGDLKIYGLVKDTSSYWRSATLDSKGMTIFSRELAERFNTGNLEVFSLRATMVKPWRGDTGNIAFSAELALGSSKTVKFTYVNQNLYLNEDGLGWKILSESDMVGYQLYQMVMTMVYPLPEDYQIEGWLFTPLDDIQYSEQLVGGFRLEKDDTVTGKNIRIEVRFDKQTDRLIRYQETHSARGSLIISYGYDQPDLKIQIPLTPDTFS